MAGKLTGNAIEDGTIVSSLLDSELSNSVGFIKVSSIVYPSGSSVSAAGNDVIELVGSGFDSNANVYINYTLVSNITVTNSSSISVTTPAQNAGIYLIQVRNPNGESIDVVPGITYSVPLSPEQGTVSGYTSGGTAPPPTAFLNTVDKFPFSSDSNATDVGNLTQGRYYVAGSSSSTHGYTTGGVIGFPLRTNVIDKFPFSSDSNASDVGNLSAISDRGIGISGETSGYHASTRNPTSANRVDKYSFSSDGNASDALDLTVARYAGGGHSSTSHGYASGGNLPTTNTIDKFPFASDTNATDVGDLTQARTSCAGGSSSSHGYTVGGFANPTVSNIIDKFPFATDANATDVGDLDGFNNIPATGHMNMATSNSGENGYVTGGARTPGLSQSPAFNSSSIQKYSFATDSNVTGSNSLTQARQRCTGQSY